MNKFADLTKHVFDILWGTAGMGVEELVKLGEDKLRKIRRALILTIAVTFLVSGTGICWSHWSDTLYHIGVGKGIVAAAAFWALFMSIYIVIRIDVYALILSAMIKPAALVANFNSPLTLPKVGETAKWLCGVLAWISGSCVYAMIFPIYRSYVEVVVVLAAALCLASIGAAKWFESKVPRKILMFSMAAVLIVCAVRSRSVVFASAMDEFTGNTLGGDAAWLVEKKIGQLEVANQELRAEAMANGGYSSATRQRVLNNEAVIAALKSNPQKYFAELPVLDDPYAGLKASEPAPEASNADESGTTEATEAVEEAAATPAKPAKDYSWLDDIVE